MVSPKFRFLKLLSLKSRKRDSRGDRFLLSGLEDSELVKQFFFSGGFWSAEAADFFFFLLFTCSSLIAVVENLGNSLIVV